MAFQPVPNTAQFRVRLAGVGQLANSEAEFSCYSGAPVNWTQGDLETVTDAIVAWVTSDYRTILSEDWRVIQVSGRDLEVEGGPLYVVDIDVAGTLTGDPSPAALAMYVPFKGTGGGEPLRGGMFLPVGNEAAIDGNNWLNTFRTTALAVVDALVAILDSTFVGQTHVIVSRYKSLNDDVKNAREALRDAIAATRRANGTSNTVATYSIRAAIATQRDRRGD